MKNLRKFHENVELIFEANGKKRYKLKDHILRHLEDIEECMSIDVIIKDLDKLKNIEHDLSIIIEKYGLSYDDDIGN